jgi:hypothetical protein
LIESIAVLIKDSWWLWAISSGLLAFFVAYGLVVSQWHEKKFSPVTSIITLVLLTCSCALLANGLYYVETHDLKALTVETPPAPSLPTVEPEPGKPFSGVQIQPIFTPNQMLAIFINICALILSLFYPKSLCVALLILFVIFSPEPRKRRRKK